MRDENQYDYYEIEERREPPVPQRNRSRRRRRRSVASILLPALLFGVLAAVIFQISNRLLSDRDSSGNSAEKVVETVVTPEAVSEQARAVAETPQKVALNTEWSEESGSVPLVTLTDTGTSSDKGPVAQVAGAALPSVVAITTVSVQEIDSFFYGNRRYQSSGSGSGIIVGENDDELLIATNNHVVADATTVSIVFLDGTAASENTDSSASAVEAIIKGTDEENDLAVVAVKKADIPQDILSQIRIARLGNSDDLVVGEQVVVIGNALGYGTSVTSGWVSAVHRSLSNSDGYGSDLIQTDAAINPGNSGGAMLNMQGELVGINSGKSSANYSEGMGYAIPISKAIPILESLMNRKTREKLDDSEAAYLGVSVADISREAIYIYNVPEGAFVAEAVEGQAASNAGIQRGDIIVALDGQKITAGEDLINLLQYYAAGETVDLTIARDGDNGYENQTVTVTFGSR